jgi:tetratricopeptide (TPR) repeat protein
LAIIIAVVPRFVSGLNIEAAYPVSVYVVMNYPVSQKRYAQAARFLAAADPNDGNSLITAAEASADGGTDRALVIKLVRQGLVHEPTSARGWTLLAEELTAAGDRRVAAKALSLALTLGPYDYWIAERRARLAATLFDELQPEDQRAAETQARLLWETDSLRPAIPTLVQSQQGARLMTRALQDEPDQVRLLNRWLATLRRSQQQAILR